jgi:hypothetical protein
VLGAVTSAIALLTIGCNASPPPSATPRVPTDQAIVSGGILPCKALPVSGGPRFAAGFVEVLKGQMTSRPSSPGIQQLVFPELVVTEQHVATNGSYRFVLSPGSYVLRAHYSTPGITPFKEVVLAPGSAVTADIPNMCM